MESPISSPTSLNKYQIEAEQCCYSLDLKYGVGLSDITNLADSFFDRFGCAIYGVRVPNDPLDPLMLVVECQVDAWPLLRSHLSHTDVVTETRVSTVEDLVESDMWQFTKHLVPDFPVYDNYAFDTVLGGIIVRDGSDNDINNGYEDGPTNHGSSTSNSSTMMLCQPVSL